MSKTGKYSPLEIFRTFWPVLLFILGLLVWAFNKQTVSSADFTADFTALEIRTALIEEEMPDKNMTLKLHESLASMQAQIEQRSKSRTRVENLMFKKDRNE